MNNIQLNFTDLDTYLTAQKGRIIHQVWFGTIPNKRVARKEYIKLKRYRDSWKVKNPTWCHMEWSKDTSNQLVKMFFPEYKELWKKYQYEIQRCDFVRYLVLYRYGGLYADMDYYCNKSFDEVFSIFRNDFYLVKTPNMGDTYVSNSLMFSKPKHVFWKKLMFEMEKHYKCPIYYSRHMIIMRNIQIKILPK